MTQPRIAPRYQGGPVIAPKPGDGARLLAIKEATCRLFLVTPEELVGQQRMRDIAWPRHAAMAVTRQVTSFSLHQIASRFGNRDHATVIHAIRAVQQETDKGLASTVGTRAWMAAQIRQEIGE